MMKKKYGQTYLFLLLFFLYVCSLFHRTEYGRCSVKAEEIEEAQGINEKREVEELSSTQSIEVSLEEEKQALEAIELYSKGLEATVQLNDRLLAIEYYYRAIQTYPKLVGAYVNLGILLQAIGEIEKSFEILLKGAQMAEEVKDLNNLASIYNNLGFVERHINPNSVQHCLQAIKYFEKGLEANPNLIDLLYNKASALIYLRKFIEAEQIFEKILSIDPHHDGAHLDLGNIWYQR
jgi:tetratricopeptide (TPR) repeat protein